MYKTIGILCSILLLCSCSMDVTRPPSESKRTFAYTDQIQISYEVHGRGNSTIVFLHGFGASVETWRDIQSRLARDNTLYFLDLKGFGLSSKPDDGKYSIDDEAEIVLAFLKSQNLHDVTLVGHSYGGAVCLFTYFKDRSSHDGGSITRLALIDAAAYVQSFPSFIGILRIPVINWIVMNLVPAQSRASYVLHRLFHDDARLSDEKISRHAAFLNQPGSFNSFVECAKQLVPANPDSISALIKTIEVPTLILWGADDPAIPVEQARRLHQDIRSSRLVVISQCGHVPHEEAPEESLKAILDFLAARSAEEN
ncbi:MAG: alpha/beta hydrolase [Ignavibacteriales bacterium]|nr:alpha/beta hydrolase [Ignavibacteriales bacterium]